MMRAAFAIIMLSAIALAQTSDPSPQSANAHGTNARHLTVRGCVTGDQRYSSPRRAPGPVFLWKEILASSRAPRAS